MKKSILTSFALVLFALASNAQGPGNSTTASHNVKINAASVLDIVMTATTDVELDFEDSDDYENGVDAPAAAELKVKSNKGWQVAVTTTEENFASESGDNDSELPASALKVRKTGDVDYVSIDSGDAIATGSKGGHTGDRVFTIDYNLNPGYFAADTYTIPVTFTISNP